jgi:hypothetical protein
MGELSTVAAEVLDQLGPMIGTLTRRAVAQAATDNRIPVREGGTVVNVDATAGIAGVIPDSALAADGAPVFATVTGPLPAPGDRVWLQYDPPSGVAVVGRMRGIPGLLAAPTPTDLSTPVSCTTGGNQLTSCVVRVQGSRLIRVTGHVGIMSGASAGLVASMYIAENNVQVGEPIDRNTFATTDDRSLHGFTILRELTGGPHTLQLMVITSTGSINAGGTASMVVEDIGALTAA